MHRLILIAHSPRLQPGRWECDVLTPTAAADLITAAHRSRALVNRVTFDSTLDVVYALTGLSLKRYDSDDETDARSGKITREPGDTFLVVMLSERGKKKPRGAALDSTDLDFYRVVYDAR